MTKKFILLIFILSVLLLLQSRRASALDLGDMLTLSQSNITPTPFNPYPLKAKIKALEKKKKLQRIKAQKAAKRRAYIAKIKRAWKLHPAGNNYVWGNCTWGVANWIPVPMGLGNANTWDDYARAWGFPVTDTPKAGAVGVSNYGYYGHVVLVLKRLSGGRILIREQNYDWYGSVRTRIANAKEFVYVYFDRF